MKRPAKTRAVRRGRGITIHFGETDGRRLASELNSGKSSWDALEAIGEPKVAAPKPPAQADEGTRKP